jgi:hypothetical protein
MGPPALKTWEVLWGKRSAAMQHCNVSFTEKQDQRKAELTHGFALESRQIDKCLILHWSHVAWYRRKRSRRLRVWVDIATMRKERSSISVHR